MASGEEHPDSDLFGYMACPFCASHLHGHGWRKRYLEMEPGRFILVWIHRKKCPHCRRTYTLIPEGMAAITQYPIARIAEALAYRHAEGHCSPSLRIPTSTQKRWWRNFITRVKSEKGMFPSSSDIISGISSIGPVSVLPVTLLATRDRAELAQVGTHPPSPHHRRIILFHGIPW